jgi:hypothetical protein
MILTLKMVGLAFEASILYGTHRGERLREKGREQLHSFGEGKSLLFGLRQQLLSPHPPAAAQSCSSGRKRKKSLKNSFSLEVFFKTSGSVTFWYGSEFGDPCLLWILDILVRIRIRASDQWIRLRILLFSSSTFKTPTKNYDIF